MTAVQSGAPHTAHVARASFRPERRRTLGRTGGGKIRKGGPEHDKALVLASFQIPFRCPALLGALPLRQKIKKTTKKNTSLGPCRGIGYTVPVDVPASWGQALR